MKSTRNGQTGRSGGEVQFSPGASREADFDAKTPPDFGVEVRIDAWAPVLVRGGKPQALTLLSIRQYYASCWHLRG